MAQEQVKKRAEEVEATQSMDRKPGGGKIREYAEAILLALVLALFIRTFVVQAFKIPSPSMVPTLLVGDHILVNKFLYGFRIPFTDTKILTLKTPRNGDIIVFRMEDGRDFIKRVIGTPGDTIALESGRLSVNGQPVTLVPVTEMEEEFGFYFIQDLAGEDNGDRRGAEDYVETITEKKHLLRFYPEYPTARNFAPRTIPEDRYFVMGDNRDNSHDSRFWGFVDETDIKGKAMIIYWSWDKERKLPRFRRLGDTVK